MRNEWLQADIKFSLLKKLSSEFEELTFAPSGPGIPKAADDTNRFHLTYPLGQYDRPCFGIEYNSSVPGKPGAVAQFTQSSLFTLFVLGEAGQGWDVERKIQLAIKVLHAELIPRFYWDEKKKIFERPWVSTFTAKYQGDRVSSARTASDKPEGLIQFLVES